MDTDTKVVCDSLTFNLSQSQNIQGLRMLGRGLLLCLSLAVSCGVSPVQGFCPAGRAPAWHQTKRGDSLCSKPTKTSVQGIRAEASHSPDGTGHSGLPRRVVTVAACGALLAAIAGGGDADASVRLERKEPQVTWIFVVVG